MEAQESKKQSLREQGRQYLAQLDEEGKFFFDQEKEEKEKIKNFFKKLFEKKDDALNDK